MANAPIPRPPHHSLELEIEKLMRHLPGADPSLVGDLEPVIPLLPKDEAPAPRTSGAVPRPSTAIPRPSAHGRTRRRIAMATPMGFSFSSAGSGIREWMAEAATHLPEALVWMRALLAAGLGVAVLQWPYAHDCGPMLYLYCFVVAAVLVSGGWASVWAWRLRIASAHVLSLIAVFWGIVLAAEQVLPRIGYAAVDAAWRCVG